MYENKTTNGNGEHAPVSGGVSDFFPGVAGLLRGQGAEVGELGPSGVQSTSDDAGRRGEKARIESLATQAARAGHTLLESCPYPFHQWQGEHFRAVFALAGGKLR